MAGLLTEARKIKGGENACVRKRNGRKKKSGKKRKNGENLVSD